MIAALDGTPLTVATGGIRRYTEELARALRSGFPDDTFVLLSDQTAPLPRRPLARRWWLAGVQYAMRENGAVLFHGTDFSVPYLPLRPSVLTLHDLSPWRDPAWHSAADRVRRRTPLLLRLGIATLVIVPSEAIRREAVDRFQLHPRRVTAIPEAAAAVFRPRLENAGAPPYFLYAGTLEPRKNLNVIVSAWAAVRQRFDVRLVLAGRQRGDWTVEPRPGLELAGAVSDEELAGLYSGALAVLYPSLYEGFGLPVLEAMQCGAPVLTSTDPAITETSGGAALHLDPRDARAWAEAMEALLVNSEMRCTLRRRSLARAAEFSWERTARQTREAYTEAIRRFHG